MINTNPDSDQNPERDDELQDDEQDDTTPTALDLDDATELDTDDALEDDDNIADDDEADADDDDDDADDDDDDDDDDDESDANEDREAAPDSASAAAAGTDASPAAEQLAAFVRHVLSNLIDDDTQLQVIPEQRGSSVHIRVLVPEEELGRVIGRQGRIARSMRTLLTIAAARRNLRASLDIDATPA